MKSRAALIVFLAAITLFVLGLWQLFKLRFDAGDVYPPYSSLRADPLGTMAFYESLERMPGLSVQRDFSTHGRLPDPSGTVYLHVSGDHREWRRLPAETIKEIDAFVLGGGRLAIFFEGEAAESRATRSAERRTGTDAKEPSSDSRKKSKSGKDRKKTGREQPEPVSLSEHWKVEFGLIPLMSDEDDTYRPATVARRADLPLPRSLEWHSGIILTNSDPAWEVIYARGRHPVVAERRMGAGSVLLATDSYYLSNEAMRQDRYPELLAWMVGPARRVVFDEAHLGIAESPGIAGMIRKYRLHAVVAALALLAGLFIWQNSLSLVPRGAQSPATGHVAGKETAAGFVNLLRRNIRVRDLLRTCLGEWKKLAPRTDQRLQERAAQAEAILNQPLATSRRGEALARLYREASQILNPPKN